MLKRPITYTNFNTGEEVTENFYFNLSEAELIDMEVDVEGGMANLLQKIIDSHNGKEIIRTFKKIVMDSYGVRSDDGKRFIKNDQLREEFSQTAAYHVLFMDLATNAEAAADFVKGVMPAKVVEEAERVDAQKKKIVTHDGRTTTAS